jgi:hypothetical protein
MLACQRETKQDLTPTPAAELPIVALTRDISVTLTGVELTPDGLLLTLRIADLELGRSRLGYEQPTNDEIALDGLDWAHGDVTQSSAFQAVQTQSGSLAQVSAWDLRLFVRLTNDMSKPVSVSLRRLRPVDEAVQSGVPKKFEGPWYFTFMPAAVIGPP